MSKVFISLFLGFFTAINSPIFSETHLTNLELIQDERAWITHSYLPRLTGSVLYIGVGLYTMDYYLKVQNPALFETIDFLEERAIYGSPYKHHVQDFMLLDTKHQYDHVSFFGILGFYIKKYAPFETIELISQSLHQVHNLVKIGGTLHLGMNHNGLPDQDMPFWEEQFKHPIFDKYEVIVLGISPYNIVWWGRKIAD